MERNFNFVGQLFENKKRVVTDASGSAILSPDDSFGVEVKSIDGVANFNFKIPNT